MLRPGHVVWLCALALLMLGVVMVNSAGMSVGSSTPATLESVLLSRSTVYMAIAVAAMSVCSLLPVRRWLLGLAGAPGAADPFLGAPAQRSGWQRRGLWVTAALLIAFCSLAYVPGIGREVNGSHRWIGVVIPGLGDQTHAPSRRRASEKLDRRER